MTESLVEKIRDKIKFILLEMIDIDHLMNDAHLLDKEEYAEITTKLKYLKSVLDDLMFNQDWLKDL